MSILRRLSSPFSNWEPRRPNTSDNLTLETRNAVFRWQLGSSDFTRLDSSTLLRADICTSQTYADKVLKACRKTGIINPESGLPNTALIDRQMVKSMPMIGLPKQRELVMLLFFWEEEVTRWRLLGMEEEEIRGRLSEAGLSEGSRVELEEALKFLAAKKRVVPSLRDQSGRVNFTGDEQLPSYDEARRQRYN